MKKQTIIQWVIFTAISLVSIIAFDLRVFAIGNYGVNLGSAAYQTSINPFYAKYKGDPTNGYGGQCTWYAWGRAYEKLGVTLPCRGNANNWTTEAANAGYQTGTVARENSIMVEHYSGTGHVFFVERIADGYAYVTEGNWNGYYHEDSINLSTYRRTAWQSHQMGPVDYIYLGGVSTNPPAGHVDLLEGGEGTIRVAGWAIDNDTPDEQLSIHIYIGGAAGTGNTAKTFIIRANEYRSDVGWHAFDQTLEVPLMGDYEVHLYAINTGEGSNAYLNEYDYKTVTIEGGKVMSEGYGHTLPDGDYQIVTAINEDYGLDVDGVDSFGFAPNIQVWKNRNENMDIFHLSYDEETGFYTIKHTLSEKYLDVEFGSPIARTNVRVHPYNGSDAQQWAIRKSDNNSYNIEAKCSGYRLDVCYGRLYDDIANNVWTHPKNTADAQKWIFVPCSSSNGDDNSEDNENSGDDNKTGADYNPVENITLDSYYLSMKVGDVVKLKSTVNPNDATEKALYWICSDESIASVEDGIIKALQPGKATIRAESKDGLHYADCSISVIEESPVFDDKNKNMNDNNVDKDKIENTGDEDKTRTEPIPLSGSVSDNQPSLYSFETRDYFSIGYSHSITFSGKSKLSTANFGDITVSYNNAEYKVTKIKINKKKKLIQITGLQGADKQTIKAIKKATKGTNGLKFTVNPYYVDNSDKVSVKTKKDGSIKTVKISISGKDYKAKKTEWSYDSDTKAISFKGNNLTGSYVLD